MRTDLHAQVREILAKAGFGTVECPGPYSYDLIARKGEKLVFVKTIKNIDNLEQAQAGDLDSISQELRASTLIVAEDSHSGRLRDGTVYERDGVPAVSFETLRDMLVDGARPLVHAGRGGFYVEIDGPALRKAREGGGLSIGDFAREIGVSRRQVVGYEGGSAATVEKAIAIEETLEQSVVLPADVLERARVSLSRQLPHFEQRVVNKLHSIGFEVGYAEKSPANVIADEAGGWIVSGLGDQGLQRRAAMLRQLSEFLAAEPVFITKSACRHNISGIPVIGEKELKKLMSAEDLINRVG